MQCHEIRTAIPKLIDGALGYDQEFAVRQHINGCAQCRAVLAEYERDEQALTSYIRRAPYAPVAQNVIAEIDRQRSPWWDAFRAGSYRLASVAGLLIVIFVVGGGAWAVREMATTDSGGEDPGQEAMIGEEGPESDDDMVLTTEDDDEQIETFDTVDSQTIGMGEIEQIVGQLDESGLVIEAGQSGEGDGYTIEYGRIAFDRHFTLVEYRAEADADRATEFNIQIAETADRTGRGIALEPGEVREEWVVLPGVPTDVEQIRLMNYLGSYDDGTSLDFDVDLSPISEAASDESFPGQDIENGVELCCVEIERGVAISLLNFEQRVEDENVLEVVDQAPGVHPEVEVDGEPVTTLSPQFGLGSIDTQQQSIPLLALPDAGELTLDLEYLTLGGGGSADDSTRTVQGPWTLTVDLADTGVKPEPQPTEPPVVAEEPTPAPDPQPEPTPTPDDTDSPESLQVLVYLVRGEELGVSSREIAYTQDVATASIEALLDGPSSDDQNYELGSEIPAGTELLDISLQDGTLTVDLSSQFTEGGGSASMQMRLAQVVHTGTQFDSIDDVQILIDGQNVDSIGGEGVMVDGTLSRDDFEDQAPAILIESPAPGEIVSDPVRLRGTSNTFEANLQIEILGPDGEELYRDFDTASSGTGTRGEFDLTIPIDPDSDGWGTIRMFEHSARDGSRTNVVDIPVRFEADQS
jgi:germination protein M